MKYSTPELIVLGSASVLVLGDDPNGTENGGTFVTKVSMGIVLGLDD